MCPAKPSGSRLGNNERVYVLFFRLKGTKDVFFFKASKGFWGMRIFITLPGDSNKGTKKKKSQIYWGFLGGIGNIKFDERAFLQERNVTSSTPSLLEIEPFKSPLLFTSLNFMTQTWF